MNRRVLRFLALLALVLRGGALLGTDRVARVLAEEESSIEIQFAFSAPVFTWRGEGEVFRGADPLAPPVLEVRVAGCRPGPEGGPVSLPFHRERIAVPAGLQVDLEVLEADRTRIPWGATGLPQEAAALLTGREPAARVRPPVPREVSLGPEGWVRFRRYVPIEVSPVRWDPSAGDFIFTRRIVVRLSFTGSPADAGSVVRGAGEELFAGVYGTTLLNGSGPAAARSGRPEIGLPGGPSPLPVSRRSLNGERRPGDLAPARPPGLRGSLLSSRFRLRVTREGIYRIRGADLTAAGADLAGVDPATLKLLLDGQEVAIEVSDLPPAGSMDPGDWLEFYGVPRTGEPELDADGNTIPDNDGVWESGDFTDVNVYWLEAGGAPGLRVGRRDAAPGKGFPLLPDAAAKARFERNTFFHGKSLGYGVTHWFDDSVVGPTSVSGNPLWSVQVPLPGLNPSSARAASVLWQVAGRTEVPCSPAHHAILCAGGAPSDCESGATRVDEATWDGLAMIRREAAVPLGSLSDPAAIHLHIPDNCNTSNPLDIQNLDFYEITYPRLLVAQGDWLPALVDPGDWRIEAGGFTAADPAAYAVWDVTDPRSPVSLTGATLSGTGPFLVSLEDAGASERRLALAAFPSGEALPDAIEEDARAGLTEPGIGADVVILTGSPLTGSPAIADYLAHRQARDPGLVLRVVDVQDVWDEFNHGILDPRAIPAFLEHALANWSPAPSVLLLFGDGSVDTKDTFGIGGAVVPTIPYDKLDTNRYLGYYGSDASLVRVVGSDYLPDLFVGRLPARSSAELQVMVDKIIGYESASPAGDWRAHFLLTEDRPEAGNPVEADAFRGVHDRVLADLLKPPHTWTRMSYDVGYPPPDGPLVFRDQMAAEIDAGVVLDTFIGHGNTSSIGDDTLFSNFRGGVFPGDVDLLGNGGPGPADPGRLPLLLHANCLTGAFMNPNSVGGAPLDSLIESFLKTPGKGAWGAIAPAGLVRAGLVELSVRPVFEGLLGDDRDRRLGDLQFRALAELEGTNAFEEAVMLTAFGDPLTPLVLPAPARPLGLVATGGDRRVDLSWNPAPPGDNVVSWTILRSVAGPDGLFSEAPGSPAAGTAFADTSVSNATEYCYRVVANNARGFTSGRSAAACATPCRATPPPPPAGVSVADPGDGTSLQVSWIALPPSEEIASYTVRWGTTPGGPYPSERSVTGSSALLTGLAEGTACYILVTATSVCGLESAPSPEVTATPRVEAGIPVPAMVRTLRVFKVPPADIRLEWDAVTLDTHGDPATVAQYEIYRATTPDFALDPAYRVATIPCTPPCGGLMSWTDPGALAAPLNHHYLVVARDPAGEPSGASNDLPRGVRDLRVRRSGPGTLRLDWSPVALDISGAPAVIREYRVYGLASPVLREDIRLLTPLAGGVVPASPALVTDSLSYYSVFAVDARGNLSPY